MYFFFFFEGVQIRACYVIMVCPQYIISEYVYCRHMVENLCNRSILGPWNKNSESGDGPKAVLCYVRVLVLLGW